jgi:hypothetical protein
VVDLVVPLLLLLPRRRLLLHLRICTGLSSVQPCTAASLPSAILHAETQFEAAV